MRGDSIRRVRLVAESGSPSPDVSRARARDEARSYWMALAAVAFTVASVAWWRQAVRSSAARCGALPDTCAVVEGTSASAFRELAIGRNVSLIAYRESEPAAARLTLHDLKCIRC